MNQRVLKGNPVFGIEWNVDEYTPPAEFLLSSHESVRWGLDFYSGRPEGTANILDLSRANSEGLPDF